MTSETEEAVSHSYFRVHDFETACELGYALHFSPLTYSSVCGRNILPEIVSYPAGIP